MLKLRKVSPLDREELQFICKESYTRIFADHWTGNGLEVYLEQQFGDNRLNTELANEDIEYFIIQKNESNIGFLKITYHTSEEFSDLDTCELEKIYILPNYSGLGIGRWAMEQIIAKAIAREKEMLFLCVIDTNENAIAFYEKLGFTFHSKTRLEAPNFREELKGMDRMVLSLR